MIKKSVAIILSALLLSSCGGTPTSSESIPSVTSFSSEQVISQESSVSSKSSETVVESSEESKETVSTFEEESSVEESLVEESESSEESLLPSSVAESSEPLPPGSGAWLLNYEAIPETTAGKYNIDFDFSVSSRSGSCGFHGSYLQRGKGSKSGVSIDNTIQIAKYDDSDGSYGYFYTTTASAVFIRFIILRITATYGGQTHDFTGVPTLYSGSSIGLTGGEEVTLEKTIDEKQNIIEYSAMIPGGKFRFENKSGNAIYLLEMFYPE